MRIVCPSCETEYDVPAALLGTTARPVRCARCTAEWIPDGFAAPAPVRPIPPEIIAPVAPPLATAPLLTEAARLPTTSRSVRGSPLWPALAWLATVAIIVAAGASFYAWRAGIAHAWPPSQWIYDHLGVPTTSE